MSRIRWTMAVLALSPAALHGSHLEDEHDLSTTFQTPHVKWATPYALGKTRVLFFVAVRPDETLARTGVELLQRFDLEAAAAYYDPRARQWIGDKAGLERLATLLAQARDAYVFLQVGVGDLPEAGRRVVAEQVEQGAGLVLVGADDGGLARTATAPKERPARLEAAGTFAVGKGRLVRMPAPTPVPYRVGWQVDLEYRFEALGRAILWSAGRAPHMDMSVSIPPEVKRADLPLSVSVTWKRAEPGANVEAIARRWDGRTWPLGQAACPAPEGSASWRLPMLRAGAYHLDVIARSAQAIVSWATQPFAVVSALEVKAVRLDRPWAEVGEEMAGHVELSGALPADSRLLLRVMDRWERLLAVQELKPAAPGAAFRFRIEPWMPMLLRIEAAVVQGDDEVAAAYAFGRVTRRHRDQFNLVVWGYPSTDLAPYAVEQLKRMGMTVVLSGGDPSPVLAAYDIAYIPYATWLGSDFFTVTQSLTDQGVMRGGCWNDPEGVRRRVEETVQKCQAARGHGVLAYSLGDECAVRGSCLSPHCLKAYQDYLREVYGRIEALNAEWGTQWARFEDVTLSPAQDFPAADAPEWFKAYYQERLAVFDKLVKKSPKAHRVTPAMIRAGDQNDEIASLQAANYARWYDRQAFQCWNLVRFAKRYAEAFRAIDPQARTGFEGTNSFQIPRHPERIRQGGDVDLIVRELDWWGPYPGPANEVVRSIIRPGTPWGNWMGYVKDAPGLLSGYWTMIAAGVTQVQWWRWEGVGQYHGLLAPHLGPYPASRELADDTRLVRDGLGTLLTQSVMLDDGVALLYSLPSTYIVHFDGNPRLGDYQAQHMAWHRALRAAGLQFRYVTDRQLRLGEFDAGRYKVLVLPFALALGPAEAEAIRSFVRAGGTLIADVRPGVYSGHCRRLPQPALDDLFGPARDQRKSPITNAVGKGRAVLLDGPLPGDPATLLQPLLAAAGVSARVVCRQVGGQPIPGLHLVRWQNGGIELVGLFGAYTGKAEVILPEARHVYDLRTHKSLGHGRQFTTELAAHRAGFLALLPGPAPAVALKVEPETIARGTVGKLTVTLRGAAGRHAVRLTLTDPTGAPAEWFDRVVIVSDGTATISLPIAHNEAVGSWSVRATDLYSDRPAVASFRVQ